MTQKKIDIGNTYRIRLEGVLNRSMVDWFGDITITDYKSLLLEYCQSQFRALPKISVVDERGPEHEKEFEVSVALQDRIIGLGRGRNKKQAAQFACKEALRLLDYPL